MTNIPFSFLLQCKTIANIYQYYISAHSNYSPFHAEVLICVLCEAMRTKMVKGLRGTKRRKYCRQLPAKVNSFSSLVTIWSGGRDSQVQNLLREAFVCSMCWCPSLVNPFCCLYLQSPVRYHYTCRQNDITADFVVS